MLHYLHIPQYLNKELIQMKKWTLGAHKEALFKTYAYKQVVLGFRYGESAVLYMQYIVVRMCVYEE